MPRRRRWRPPACACPRPKGPARRPHLEAETAHGKGWFEVQDEGSQIAALLAGAGPRMQVLDLCAGAGGKTLALAAAMQNTGQIYAYDADKKQLRPDLRAAEARRGAQRAGDGRGRRGGADGAGAALRPRAGRRAVHRLGHLAAQARRQVAREAGATFPSAQAEQARVLDLGASLTKPGGTLVYVTCSVLPEENRDQVEAFLGAPWRLRASSHLRPSGRERIGGEPPRSADGRDDTLQLTPAQHATDGFFIALMRRHQP